jgi:predicted nucleic-acid-binding protein
MATTVAADTNLLVRLVVADDEAQAFAVVARLERIVAEGGTVILEPVVLAELSWVLQASYDFRREPIAAALERLVDRAPFHVAEKAAVVQAIADYREGPAGFSDYLILALARAKGSEALLTFGRDLLRRPDCEMP